MLRAFFVGLCRLVLTVFFRRVHVAGLSRVPRDGPVLFALNHPNGLLDPLFILCLAPREVTFLAKAPLFKTPVVRHFVKAFDCLPVYRKQDGNDPRQNAVVVRESMRVLAEGKALALFPEGTSHSEPRMKPFRPGAARIALGASAPELGARPVQIVPVGLDYSDKSRFRSEATLVFGEAFPTPPVALTDYEPPAAAVAALTATILERLERLTPQADTRQALAVSDVVARLVEGYEAEQRDGASDAPPPSVRVRQRLGVRQRAIRAYERLACEDPAALHDIAERLFEYASVCSLVGLRLESAGAQRRRRLVPFLVLEVLGLVALALPAASGALLHYPAYRAIDALAHRMAKGAEDVLGSLKAVAGLLFFPATWLLAACLVGSRWGWIAAGGTVLLGPLLGYAALVGRERFARLGARLRIARVVAIRRSLLDYLKEERRALVAEMVRFENASEAAPE